MVGGVVEGGVVAGGETACVRFDGDRAGAVVFGVEFGVALVDRFGVGFVVGVEVLSRVCVVGAGVVVAVVPRLSLTVTGLTACSLPRACPVGASTDCDEGASLGMNAHAVTTATIVTATIERSAARRFEEILEDICDPQS